MPESRPPIDLKGLSFTELETMIAERRLPPVERWNPGALRQFRHAHRARRHLVSPGRSPSAGPRWCACSRPSLRREPDGSHVLVTPVEKLTIEVEATAFRAVEMISEGDGKGRRIALKLDNGDALVIGADHPLRITPTDAGPSPRVLVRHGLEAELSRSIYYELAELALAEGSDPPGIWSDGQVFPLDAGRMNLAERLRAAMTGPADDRFAPRRLARSPGWGNSGGRSDRRHRPSRARHDPDPSPRASAHPCRASRLSRRAHRSRRGRGRRGAARGRGGNRARSRPGHA